jgi:hypothetical protein
MTITATTDTIGLFSEKPMGVLVVSRSRHADLTTAEAKSAALTPMWAPSNPDAELALDR